MSAPAIAFALTLRLAVGDAGGMVSVVDMTDTSIYGDNKVCFAAADTYNERGRMPPMLAEAYASLLKSASSPRLGQYTVTCSVVVAAPPVDPAFYGDE